MVEYEHVVASRHRIGDFDPPPAAAIMALESETDEKLCVRRAWCVGAGRLDRVAIDLCQGVRNHVAWWRKLGDADDARVLVRREELADLGAEEPEAAPDRRRRPNRFEDGRVGA